MPGIAVYAMGMEDWEQEPLKGIQVTERDTVQIWGRYRSVQSCGEGKGPQRADEEHTESESTKGTWDSSTCE